MAREAPAQQRTPLTTEYVTHETNLGGQRFNVRSVDAEPGCRTKQRSSGECARTPPPPAPMGIHAPRPTPFPSPQGEVDRRMRRATSLRVGSARPSLLLEGTADQTPIRPPRRMLSAPQDKPPPPTVGLWLYLSPLIPDPSRKPWPFPNRCLRGSDPGGRGSTGWSRPPPVSGAAVLKEPLRDALQRWDWCTFGGWDKQHLGSGPWDTRRCPWGPDSPSRL